MVIVRSILLIQDTISKPSRGFLPLRRSEETVSHPVSTYQNSNESKVSFPKAIAYSCVESQ